MLLRYIGYMHVLSQENALNSTGSPNIIIHSDIECMLVSLMVTLKLSLRFYLKVGVC